MCSTPVMLTRDQNSPAEKRRSKSKMSGAQVVRAEKRILPGL